MDSFMCTDCGITFRPSLKTVLKNTCDLEKQLPESAGSFMNYLDSITSLHKMCIENDFSDNYKEIIENFKESFEVVHQLFGLSQTLKIHIIVNHYSDYFEMTGTNFKDTNGEHHEALHHTLKEMERNRGLHMKKKHGSPVHQQKSLKSIVTRNVLSAGFTPKHKLRIRKSRCSSESSNSPRSSPIKGVFMSKKSIVNNVLDRINE
jgi:hypothetical protein